MLTVAIVSQKGGAGKSTLAASLAVAATEYGLWTCVADTDPQKTLTKWHLKRLQRQGGQSPDIATFTEWSPRLNRQLKQDDGGRGVTPHLMLIDTRPSVDTDISMVVESADFVLVPIQPTPPDVQAVGATIGMIHDKMLDRGEFAFVLNRCPPKSVLIAPAIAALSSHGVICPHFLSDRRLYQTMFSTGHGPTEIDRAGDEANEVRGVLSFLLGRSKIAKRLRLEKPDAVLEGAV